MFLDQGRNLARSRTEYKSGTFKQFPLPRVCRSLYQASPRQSSLGGGDVRAGGRESHLSKRLPATDNALLTIATAVTTDQLMLPFRCDACHEGGVGG